MENKNKAKKGEVMINNEKYNISEVRNYVLNHYNLNNVSEEYINSFVEGWIKGFAIGMEKGIAKTALNFKKMGFPIKDIAKATGLTVEEIEKL